MSSRDVYRRTVDPGNLVTFAVISEETDLLVRATRDLQREALDSVSLHRRELESYLMLQPRFGTGLQPVDVSWDAPAIVRAMAQAGRAAGIGPMAAVAGAVAETVAHDLLRHCEEVIVENGGDVFIATVAPRTVALYAGPSPLSGRIGLTIGAGERVGVCTSCGTFGHSLSFGRADACTVVARSAALADAVATAMCNSVGTANDLPAAVDLAVGVDGVIGATAILGDRMAVRGRIGLVSLQAT